MVTAAFCPGLPVFTGILSGSRGRVPQFTVFLFDEYAVAAFYAAYQGCLGIHLAAVGKADVYLQEDFGLRFYRLRR